MTNHRNDPNNQTDRHQPTLRRDDQMFHIDLRLTDVQERHERFRTQREHDRVVTVTSPSLRQHVGQSLVRLGRRVGGDVQTTPAWQR